ncbi:hypothetical protein GCM10009411_39440 [Shewanella litoralis]|uniref:Uncharacterized protein n=1 Tax=Shewanella litoralis TaxID=2282700 RepID=A0ABQ2RM80_9GAMM|nr:hypothetical protein GCM10009411_39440 [Shewanella litoralis]
MAIARDGRNAVIAGAITAFGAGEAAQRLGDIEFSSFARPK